MEALIREIAGEAGITEEQAKIVVQVLAGYLAKTVSDPCARELESQFGRMSATESVFGRFSATESMFGICSAAAGITVAQAEIAVKVAVARFTSEVSGDCAAQIEGAFRGGG